LVLASFLLSISPLFLSFSISISISQDLAPILVYHLSGVHLGQH
jgi:hypothetical protein